MNNRYYIIVACYPDKGMKSCGSKGLLSFNNKKLIEHQISWIKAISKNNKVVVVADFDYAKIHKLLIEYGIEVLHNCNNNPILECCNNMPDGDLCFIDYGCVFNPKILSNLSFDISEVLCIREPNQSNNLDIGCTITDDYIEYMFFDLPKNSFTNVFTITQADRNKIKSINDLHDNLLYFEILNILIKYESVIRPKFIANNFIYFNHMRQKNAINKFIKQHASH
jgi:hypothetical protein